MSKTPTPNQGADMHDTQTANSGNATKSLTRWWIDIKCWATGGHSFYNEYCDHWYITGSSNE